MLQNDFSPETVRFKLDCITIFLVYNQAVTVFCHCFKNVLFIVFYSILLCLYAQKYNKNTIFMPCT